MSMNSFGLNDLVLAADTNSAYYATKGFHTVVAEMADRVD